MFKQIVFILVAMFLCSSLMSGDLEEMYKSEKTKEITSSSFVDQFKPFKWGGTNKRVAVSTTSKLFDHPIRESIAYFSAEGKLVRLDAWYYNRGDDGDMSEENFEAKYEGILFELEKYFGVKPKKTGIDGATRSTAYSFMLPSRDEVKLLVGFEKKPRFRADFINLVVRNYGRNDRVRGSGALEYLSKNTDNVFIDKIPMIDQGPKGYCVPATLARIGQHYGVDISMHEIAMIADSSSGGGTSPQQAMYELKKNYARVKLKIKEISVKYEHPVHYLSGNTWKSISPDEAKRNLESTPDDDRNYQKFVSEVKKQIDKGYIIAWSMVVGLLQENGEPARQSGGGHMRMIIGYNDKLKQFIFSDSWGSGHEIKTIDMKSAYIVTSDIYEIIP
jgi:hypothetical protein